MSKLTPQEQIEQLQAEVGRLQGALADAATATEEAAHRAMFFRNGSEEVPTGRTVKVPTCTGYDTTGFKDDGTPIRRPVWEEKDVPTYLYKIEMPPVGGVDIKINGN